MKTRLDSATERAVNKTVTRIPLPEKAEWAIAYASHNWRERILPHLRQAKKLPRGGRAETFRLISRDLRGFANAMEVAALYDEGRDPDDITDGTSSEEATK